MSLTLLVHKYLFPTCTFLNEQSVFNIVKADNSLDKVMIIELSVGFGYLFDFKLSFKNETRLRSSTLDKLFEGLLVLTNWNSSSFDSLRFEPRSADGDLENAFPG